MTPTDNDNNYPAETPGMTREEAQAYFTSGSSLSSQEWLKQQRAGTSSNGKEVTLTMRPATAEESNPANWFSLGELTDAHYEWIRRKRAQVASYSFPKAALSGLLGQWSSYMTEGNHRAPEHFYMSALTFLGHMLKDRVRVPVHANVRPQLYTILVGPPSDGKGSVLQDTLKFFNTLIPPPDHFPEINSAEGLLKKAHEEHNTDLIITPDEFSSFLKKANIENATLGDMFNTLFESSKYSYAVSDKRFLIDGLRLSFLSTIQDDRWDKLGSQLIENGFASRLMLVKRPGDFKREARPKLRTDKDDYFREELGRRLGAIAGGREYRLTKEAEALYDCWFSSLPQDEPARRLDTISFRLMSLVAFDLDKHEIDGEVVSAVTAILDWQYQVRKELEPNQAQNQSAQCCAEIKKWLRQGPQSRNELIRHGLDKWGPLFDHSLKHMVEAGDIRFENQPRKGKVYRTSN